MSCGGVEIVSSCARTKRSGGRRPQRAFMRDTEVREVM